MCDEVQPSLPILLEKGFVLTATVVRLRRTPPRPVDSLIKPSIWAVRLDVYILQLASSGSPHRGRDKRSFMRGVANSPVHRTRQTATRRAGRLSVSGLDSIQQGSISIVIVAPSKSESATENRRNTSSWMWQSSHSNKAAIGCFDLRDCRKRVSSTGLARLSRSPH